MAKLESRKMGEQPVAKLLITMALPVMFSMLTQAFYNVVDSIYVSRVSEDCLAALSIAFPVQNMLIGLATGTAVGVGTLISRALGAGDNRRADKVAGVSIFLMFCCWALLATFGIFFAESFFNAQTDMESIRQSGTVYLRIVCIGCTVIGCLGRCLAGNEQQSNAEHCRDKQRGQKPLVDRMVHSVSSLHGRSPPAG